MTDPEFVVDEDVMALEKGDRPPVFGLIISIMFPPPPEFKVLFVSHAFFVWLLKLSDKLLLRPQYT